MSHFRTHLARLLAAVLLLSAPWAHAAAPASAVQPAGIVDDLNGLIR